MQKIVVLSGGWSKERDISLKSGKGVEDALRSKGYDVVSHDPKDEDLTGFPPDADAAFIALHGTFGEDGGAQARLEALGVPYTGCGVEASRISMDKEESLRRFAEAGLPIPEGVLVAKETRAETCFEYVEQFIGGYPVVVKPCSQGSSVGVSIVKAASQLPGALRVAFQYDDRAILERKVIGREMTVGILEGEALPVIELVPKEEFYNFKAKYGDSPTEYRVNPPLEEITVRRLQWTARKAFEAVGGRDYCRVDMILDSNGVPYLLEVNTIPGMTPRSLLPKAAADAGIPYEDLCDRILRLALLRNHGSSSNQRRTPSS